MSSMNMRELPLWLKRCLIFEMITKVFEIPNDVGEKVLRHLSSRERKNSNVMITELKDAIGKYERNEHIKWCLYGQWSSFNQSEAGSVWDFD